MRALPCHRHRHLEAQDEALYAAVREHPVLGHPARAPSGEQVEEFVSARAYDLHCAGPFTDDEPLFEAYEGRRGARVAR